MRSASGASICFLYLKSEFVNLQSEIKNNFGKNTSFFWSYFSIIYHLFSFLIFLKYDKIAQNYFWLYFWVIQSKNFKFYNYSMNDNQFKYTNSVVVFPLFFVVILWSVFWLQIKYDFDFYQNGILPRTISGLQGVVLSPFIHADIQHLYNNSIPLFILLAVLRFFYQKQFLSVLGYGILFSGIITWIIGRDNYHIGASGLIYVLVSFIFLRESKLNIIVW